MVLSFLFFKLTFVPRFMKDWVMAIVSYNFSQFNWKGSLVAKCSQQMLEGPIIISHFSHRKEIGNNKSIKNEIDQKHSKND